MLYSLDIYIPNFVPTELDLVLNQEKIVENSYTYYSNKRNTKIKLYKAPNIGQIELKRWTSVSNVTLMIFFTNLCPN